MRSGRTYRNIAVTFLTFALMGCVCEDGVWMDGAWLEAEGAERPGGCDIIGMTGYSKSSLTLAERADPQLLEAARLDAERDCNKAAEIKSRPRLDAFQRSG